MNSIKSRATLVWVLTVLVVSVGAFLYLIQDDAPATKPVVPPQFFSTEVEVAETMISSLPAEIVKNRFIWIGLEPEKGEQIGIAAAFVEKLKSLNPKIKVIVDQELALKADDLKQLGYTDLIFAKENIFLLGEKLQQLEKDNVGYVFVSASIYTTSLLKKNPAHLLKEQYGIKPVSFSFAYLPVTTEDERGMVFGCSTDDHNGTATWGCAIVNRARFARRRFSVTNSKNWFALMDSVDESNYILLLKKKWISK